MNRSTTTPSDSAPADEDLVEQAHPGHGVPSQDPASAAQFPLEPEEARREASSVLMGGGMVAGAAAGATVGVLVGPASSLSDICAGIRLPDQVAANSSAKPCIGPDKPRRFMPVLNFKKTSSGC